MEQHRGWYYSSELSKIIIFRFVYKWFLFLHKLSYVLGVVGYLIMMAALLGFHVLFGVTQPTLMDVGKFFIEYNLLDYARVSGILFMFYGVYYGVLGRDFAHICTDRMASRIGVILQTTMLSVLSAQFSVLHTRWSSEKASRRRCLCSLWWPTG